LGGFGGSEIDGKPLARESTYGLQKLRGFMGNIIINFFLFFDLSEDREDRELLPYIQGLLLTLSLKGYDLFQKKIQTFDIYMEK
jgi:hypothetical protein